MSAFPTAPSSAQRGLPTIHRAILEGDFARVCQARSKERLNLQDSRGATPLMMAALTGRLKIFRYLISRRVDFSTCDNEGHSALDYCHRSARTEKLGVYMSMVQLPPPTRKQELYRMQIAAILRSPDRLASEYLRQKHPLSKAYFYPRDKELVLLKQADTVVTGGHVGKSTVGCIAGAKDQLPRAYAVSGWTQDQTPMVSHLVPVLHNKKYTRLVRRVCERVLHFELPKSQRDNGGKPALPKHKGRFLGKSQRFPSQLHVSFSPANTCLSLSR
jgi:hypothetical protein